MWLNDELTIGLGTELNAGKMTVSTRVYSREGKVQLKGSVINGGTNGWWERANDRRPVKGKERGQENTSKEGGRETGLTLHPGSGIFVPNADCPVRS